MTPNQHQRSPDSQEPKQGKKPYKTPIVTVYGDLSTITRGGSSNRDEAGNNPGAIHTHS